MVRHAIDPPPVPAAPPSSPGRIGEWRRAAALLVTFVLRDLHGRYAGSLLGLYWSVVNPLLTIGVLTLVFSVFLQIRFAPVAGTTSSFVPMLVAGVLPWLAVQEGALRAGAAMIEHPTLVRSVRFPLGLLPAAAVAAGLLHQLVGTALLFLVLGATGLAPLPAGPHFLLFPLALAGQAALTLGLGLCLAAITPYFRDLVHVAGAAFMLWIYATPIAYPPEMVPEGWRWAVAINPLAHLVALHRVALLGGGELEAALGPVMGSVASSAVIAIAAGGSALVLGVVVFRRAAPDLAFAA